MILATASMPVPDEYGTTKVVSEGCAAQSDPKQSDAIKEKILSMRFNRVIKKDVFLERAHITNKSIVKIGFLYLLKNPIKN
jgi:hypothetical protein